LIPFLLVAVLAMPLQVSPERQVLRLINQERVERGKERLKMGARMSRYAERHSRQMRDAGRVFHSDVSFPKPKDWRIAGENVGAGGGILSLHEAFMDSDEHRKNLLRNKYGRVGIGVKTDPSGRLWVTVEFLG
jgi:uncharacterized protein YkwD